MKTLKRLAVVLSALALLALPGCTSAGPFITNVYPDGKGNLVVQRAEVEFNGFFGIVSTKNQTQTTIPVNSLNVPADDGDDEPRSTRPRR